MTFDELPRTWQIHVRDLRTENAGYRLQNAALRAQIEDLTEGAATPVDSVPTE